MPRGRRMTSTTTRKASTAGFDLARSWTLAQALLWRMRQERLRNFATVFMPFVLTVTVAVVLPLVSDDSSMNGAAESARLGMEYGANADAVATGLLLVLIPGVIAVHGTVGAMAPLRLLLGAGGVTVAVIVGSLLGIARGFRPESVFGSA